MEKNKKILLTTLIVSALFANATTVFASSEEKKIPSSNTVVFSRVERKSGTIVLPPIRIYSSTSGSQSSKPTKTDSTKPAETKPTEVKTDESKVTQDKKPEVIPVQKTSESMENIKVCGLVNVSASCYLNSLVQLMYHTPTIRSTVLAYVGTNRTTSNLKKLFVKMGNAQSNQVINPREEYAGMGFHHGPDDPQITYLDQFQCDLDNIIDMYSEDNPEKNVLFDFTTTPSEKSEKGKSACAVSIATSTGGGHYYAAVRVGDKWYRVNDSSVSFIGNEFGDVLKMVKNSHHMVRMISYE